MLPGELLSAWLVRTALAQGCDPLHLTGWLWPRWRAWTVDLDRGLTADRLATLAMHSGLDSDLLNASMLHSCLPLIAPGLAHKRATWPWILALGSRNRQRRSGLQFCPLCLKNDAIPYFRRAWRFAWHVGCSEHKALLVDHCGNCQALVTPHRLKARDALVCLCSTCRVDLRMTKTTECCSEALHFQDTADRVLKDGYGVWAKTVVSSDVWFSLAHKHSSGQIYVRPSDDIPLGRTSLPLILQRPSERILRLRMAIRAMQCESRGRSLYPRRHVITTDSHAMQSPDKESKNQRQPPKTKSKESVQGEWIRLLRRLRVGHL